MRTISSIVSSMNAIPWNVWVTVDPSITQSAPISVTIDQTLQLTGYLIVRFRKSLVELHKILKRLNVEIEWRARVLKCQEVLAQWSLPC